MSKTTVHQERHKGELVTTTYWLIPTDNLEGSSEANEPQTETEDDDLGHPAVMEIETSEEEEEKREEIIPTKPKSSIPKPPIPSPTPRQSPWMDDIKQPVGVQSPAWRKSGMNPVPVATNACQMQCINHWLPIKKRQRVRNSGDGIPKPTNTKGIEKGRVVRDPKEKEKLLERGNNLPKGRKKKGKAKTRILRAKVTARTNDTAAS